MSIAASFSAKDPAEIITVSFDFASLTTTPSAPQVSVIRVDGAADAAPSSILSGAAQVSGSKVLQQITGGIDGCVYSLRAQVNAPDGSRYVMVRRLPIDVPR